MESFIIFAVCNAWDRRGMRNDRILLEKLSGCLGKLEWKRHGH